MLGPQQNWGSPAIPSSICALTAAPRARAPAVDASCPERWRAQSQRRQVVALNLWITAHASAAPLGICVSVCVAAAEDKPPPPYLPGPAQRDNACERRRCKPSDRRAFHGLVPSAPAPWSAASPAVPSRIARMAEAYDKATVSQSGSQAGVGGLYRGRRPGRADNRLGSADVAENRNGTRPTLSVYNGLDGNYEAHGKPGRRKWR
jgi:hypothetical protein